MSVAIALCRLWTAIYTLGLPAPLRVARRAEIDSDLWECRRDADTSPAAPTIVVRLLLGVPHDLLWRFEFVDPSMRPRRSIAAAAAAFAAILLSVLWMGFSLLNPVLPDPAPAMSFIAAPRPPPPPPPPPPDYLKQDAQVEHAARAARDRQHGIDR